MHFLLSLITALTLFAVPQGQSLSGRQMYDKYVSMKGREPKEAYRWLERAADAGYSQAYQPLGEYYMQVGPLSIKENISRAEKYFQKAKDSGVQDDYGYQAARLYGRAMRGESLSGRECYQVAQMMQAGLFGAVKSDERALIWFQEASRKGDESADFRISQIYMNFAEEALARKEYDEVMRCADKFYEYYDSYEPLADIAERLRLDAVQLYPNDKKAFKKPLEYSVRMGNAHVMYTLGVQYCAGTFIPKDEVKGLALLKASEKLGYSQAGETYNKMKSAFDRNTAYNNMVLQERQRKNTQTIMMAVGAGATLLAAVAIIRAGIKNMGSYNGGYSYGYSGSASVITPEADARAEDRAKAREMLGLCRPELTKVRQRDTDYWEIELGTGKAYTVERRENGNYRCNVLRRGLMEMGMYGILDAFIADYNFDSLEEAKQRLLKEEIDYYNKMLK